MPTNDERREVAARLRGLTAEHFNDDDFYVCDDVEEALRIENYAWYYRAAGVLRLADLIEPEPERTCRAIYDGDDSGHEFAGKSWHCSVCGHEMDEYEAKCGVYCIICGAKVVDE